MAQQIAVSILITGISDTKIDTIDFDRLFAVYIDTNKHIVVESRKITDKAYQHYILPHSVICSCGDNPVWHQVIVGDGLDACEMSLLRMWEGKYAFNQHFHYGLKARLSVQKGFSHGMDRIQTRV